MDRTLLIKCVSFRVKVKLAYVRWLAAVIGNTFFIENDETLKIQFSTGHPKNYKSFTTLAGQLNTNPRCGVLLKWAGLHNSSAFLFFFLFLRSKLAYVRWVATIITNTFFYWKWPSTPRYYSLVFVNVVLTWWGFYQNLPIVQFECKTCIILGSEVKMSPCLVLCKFHYK